ncbi:MAG: hypothetical protein ACWGHH_08685 [Sulfurovaceae bacterium]
MKKYNLLFGIIIAVISFITTACVAVDAKNNMVHKCFTPLEGTPIRQDILDTLRKEVKRTHGIDAVFVVEYLRVQDGWAWVHAFPQSADGKNKYEDIHALLRLQNSEWKTMEIPCTEVENPECLDDPSYFPKLKQRFPNMPEQILPEE